MRNSAALSSTTANAAPAVGARAPRPASGSLALTRDPFRLTLFVLLILNVSRAHLHFPALAKTRPALLLTIIAVGYAWAHPKYLTRISVFKHMPMRRIAILGILACISAVFGISLGNSAKYFLDSYGKTLVGAFLLILGIRNARDLYTLVVGYSISCGILSFFALFVFGLSKGQSAVERLSDLYTYDANDLGLVLIVGLPFTLLLMHVVRGPARLALFANVVAIMIALARSGSRGAFLGIVAVGFAALMLVNTVSASRRIGILVFGVVALLLGAPPGYWDQMQTMTTPSDDYNLTSTDGRKQVAQRGLAYIAAYPVFGLGINNFARAECTISAGKAEKGGHLRCGAPHNSYIQVASEIGIPGFFVWLSIVFGSIRGMLKLRRRLPRAWIRGTDTERFLYSATHYFALTMIGFAVTCFFLSFAWVDIFYIVAVFISGLYAAVQTYVQAAGVAAAPSSARGRQRGGWRVLRSAARYPAALMPSPAGGGAMRTPPILGTGTVIVPPA